MAPAPPDEKLNAKFRTILKLTELVTALNNNDHPTLRLPYKQKPKRTPDANEDLVFAIATILVRNNEVVAVGVSGPHVIAVEQQGETTSSQPDSSDDQPDSVDGQPDIADDRQRDSMAIPFDEDFDYSSIHADRITAVANPRDRETYEFPGNCSCVLVSNGKPLLEQQWTDDVWQHFHAQRPSTLANHICTLEQYLEFYRATADGPPKHKLQNLFTRYLVVHCWEKMLRRIGDWSAQGCIYVLGSINLDMLRSQVKLIETLPVKYTNLNNKELGVLVIWMVENELMATVVMEPSGKPWNQQLLADLVTLFKGGDYNKTTCADFHQLLVAALLSYGHALYALSNHKGEPKTFDQKYHRVYICASLLRQLASSLMLRQHLWVCKSLLHTPINTEHSLNNYNTYTGFPKLGCHDYMSGGPDHDFTDEGDIDEVFLVWIRLQAAHLLALGTISRAFGSPDSKIPTVCLVAVKSSQDRKPVMEDWEVTVDDIFAHTPHGNLNPQVNAEAVKKAILARTLPTTTSNRHTIFKNFNRIHNPDPNRPNAPAFGNATEHCEMVLTTLPKYPCEKILDEADGELMGLFKNLDQNLIGVSKSCCPVCWELLCIFEDPTHRFHVRGRHPTVFPVELPSWLPPKEMRRLIARFQELLLEEIWVMMSPRVIRPRTSSQQSHSAMSTGTHHGAKDMSSDDPLA